jgi:hypothetical protein
MPKSSVTPDDEPEIVTLDPQRDWGDIKCYVRMKPSQRLIVDTSQIVGKPIEGKPPETDRAGRPDRPQIESDDCSGGNRQRDTAVF